MDLAGRGPGAATVRLRLRPLRGRAASRNRRRSVGRRGGPGAHRRDDLVRRIGAERRTCADHPDRRRPLGHAAPAGRRQRRPRRRGRRGRANRERRRERRLGHAAAARPPRRQADGRRGGLPRSAPLPARARKGPGRGACASRALASSRCSGALASSRRRCACPCSCARPVGRAGLAGGARRARAPGRGTRDARTGPAGYACGEQGARTAGSGVGAARRPCGRLRVDRRTSAHCGRGGRRVAPRLRFRDPCRRAGRPTSACAHPTAGSTRGARARADHDAVGTWWSRDAERAPPSSNAVVRERASGPRASARARGAAAGRISTSHEHGDALTTEPPTGRSTHRAARRRGACAGARGRTSCAPGHSQRATYH
jgi:hypothetical protein